MISIKPSNRKIILLVLTNENIFRDEKVESVDWWRNSVQCNTTLEVTYPPDHGSAVAN